MHPPAGTEPADTGSRRRDTLRASRETLQEAEKRADKFQGEVHEGFRQHQIQQQAKASEQKLGQTLLLLRKTFSQQTSRSKRPEAEIEGPKPMET